MSVLERLYAVAVKRLPASLLGLLIAVALIGILVAVVLIFGVQYHILNTLR